MAISLFLITPGGLAQLAKALLNTTTNRFGAGKKKTFRIMKAISSSDKSKNGSEIRNEKETDDNGEMFLGYKALHELRILMRIASNRNSPPSKDDEKPSF